MFDSSDAFLILASSASAANWPVSPRAHFTRAKRVQLTVSRLKDLLLPINTNTMSSPANRRGTRSSSNNTPSSRRSQRSNASQVPPPPSSDAANPEEDGDGDAATSQLLSEADAAGTTPRASQRSQRASARGTPRASQQSQAPPTSSPLFFRSSPAGSQSQSQGLGVPAANGSVQGSSPLRQRTDARLGSSEGGRTPRGVPGIGG